jgi:hypothetical protein
MKKWLFLFVSSLIVICCNNERGLIPRRDLVPILVDMHIADAIAMTHMISQQFGGLDSAMLYDAVFTRHGYTKDDFIITLRYYSEKPDVLVKIYDDVFSELTIRSEEAKEMYNSTTPSRTNMIWKSDSARYKAYGDTAMYPEAFDIELDTNGTFVISAEIKLTKKDQSKNPRISAFFYRPGKDSITGRKYFEEEYLLKTDQFREYRMLKKYTGKLPVRLRIIIPLNDKIDTAYVKSFEMQNLHVSILHSDKDN